MALVSLSFKFFRALETALEAVKNGDARLAVLELNCIKEGGLLLRQHTALLRDQLKEAKKEQQQKVEILTRDMNELYKQEEDLKKKITELETKKHLMVKERERSSRKKQDAWRRYKQAQTEMKDAESKYKEFQNYWWVPIYGTYLGVRELFESNTTKVREAHKEMQGYERDMERAEEDIAWANSAVWEVQFCILNLSCVLYISICRLKTLSLEKYIIAYTHKKSFSQSPYV